MRRMGKITRILTIVALLVVSIPFIAQPVLAADTGSISGTVYQADGTTPIAGAEVRVFDYVSVFFGKAPAPLAGPAVTGSNGHYVISDLPAGDYAVRARASGYAAEWYNDVYIAAQVAWVRVTAPNDTPGINFSLAPGVAISGHVYRAGTTPVPAALVTVFDYSSLPGQPVGRGRAQTNESGYYITDGLPTGTYGLRVETASYVTVWYNNVYSAAQATEVSITAPGEAINIDFTVTVPKANTTTVVASSTNPAVFRQSVNFTATVSVTPPATGSPTGTVDFKDGLTTIAFAVPLSGNTATFATRLSVGSHAITAAYNGDDNFLGSTSSPLTQTVNKANTATVVASSANPAVFGQPVTFTANVSVMPKPVPSTWIDAHAHLVPTPPGVNAFDLLVSRMDTAGISKTILFCGPPNNARVSQATLKYPGRIIPFRNANDMDSLIMQNPSLNDPTLLEPIRADLATGLFRGLGEIVTRHEVTSIPANHPMKLAVYRLGAEYHIPVNVHCFVGPAQDPTGQWLAEFENALSQCPSTTFIWAHSGPATPDVMRGVLDRHPNLYADLSTLGPVRNWVQGPAHVKPYARIATQAWFQLLEDYPDRFLFGTDPTCVEGYVGLPTFVGYYTENVFPYLSTGTVEAIAHGNAERLLGIAPSSPLAGSPTGTVQFTNYGDPVPLVNGSATGNAISTLAVGNHTVPAVYSGDGKFNGSSGSLVQRVLYNFSGFFQPIPLPVSTFQGGSTIPVKFALTAFNGVSIGTATAVVSVNGGPAIGTARYDPSGQYIFNLRTKGLPLGALTISVSLDDGTIHSVVVQLK